MELSNDLLSQFAKVTNDKKDTKKETTVYGTIKEWNGGTYVQLDGSDLYTPYESSVDVKPGERVSIKIKDHSATVTGNISSPAARVGSVEEIDGKVAVYIDTLEAESARIDTLVADNVKINETLVANEAVIDGLEAKTAKIDDLEADNARIDRLVAGKIDADVANATFATIKDLEATNTDIHNLDATFATIEQLTAMDATIKELDTEKLSAESAELRFANIDFANIGEAAIQKLFSESGIISDLVMQDGHVTGNLVGVTISGDLIEGNTIKAEKLIVKGSDGLYYKLNVEGGVTTSDTLTKEELQNGLHGSIIIAKSITADQIYVSDLVAFGATIGGFKITNNAIHSVVKTSATNTTRGIYLDNDGQFATGDSERYLRYYKDTNGDYKLEIAADAIKFGTGKKTIEDALIENVESAIEQTTNSITSTVRSEVANIAIGGRNLLEKTNDEWIDFSFYSLAFKLSPNINGVIKQRFHYEDLGLRHGDYVTFSLDLNAINRPLAARVTLYSVASGNDGKNTLPYGNTISQGDIGKSSITLQLDSATPYLELYITDISSTGTGDTHTEQYKALKLEKGNKPTDWSPAPEDVDFKIDDLEIGAANLIQNSNFIDGVNKWQMPGVTASVEIDSTHGTCLKITSTVAGDGDHRVYPDTTTNFIHTGGTYSLSFYARADVATSLQSNVSGGTEVFKNYDLTTSWKRYTHTYDASGGSITFWLNDANTTAYITKVQVERGDKVTDWSLALADVSSMKELENSTTELNDRIDSLDDRVTDATSAIQQLSDSISMFVTDGNGSSLMTQTENGWTFNIGTIESAVNDVTNAVDDLQKLTNSTDSTVTSLKDAIENISKITERINVGTYTYVDDEGVRQTEPSIEWSETDTDFKLIMTNTQALFMDGPRNPTKINTTGMITENMTVQRDFRQGDFVWAVRSIGNYGLMWKGAGE